MDGHRFCTGCGREDPACPGCNQNDPPHYCPECGAWMAVLVTPTGWSARCRDHGEVEHGTGVSTSGLLD